MTIEQLLAEVEPALYCAKDGSLQREPRQDTRSDMAVTVWTRDYSDWDMTALEVALAAFVAE